MEMLTLGQVILQQKNTDQSKENAKALELEEKAQEKLNQARERADHNYWQGQFTDSLSSMTKTNDELVAMNKYYADLEKSSKETVTSINKTYDEYEKLIKAKQSLETKQVKNTATAADLNELEQTQNKIAEIEEKIYSLQ
jgi:arylamine N-acetyltransferase